VGSIFTLNVSAEPAILYRLSNQRSILIRRLHGTLEDLYLAYGDLHRSTAATDLPHSWLPES
jgi:hypothetical protein